LKQGVVKEFGILIPFSEPMDSGFLFPMHLLLLFSLMKI